MNETRVENRTLVLFGRGDPFSIRAVSSSVRFLQLTGKPLNEPVAWQGSIVINTKTGLAIAFQEYRNKTFIKHN